MEPRTLSSAQTFFMKVLLPLAWTTGFGIITASMFVDASSWASPAGATAVVALRWTFLAITLAGGGAMLAGPARLKRVRLDGNMLLVSNYFREERIPLAWVARVTQQQWLRSRPIVIHFHRPTRFGARIRFMPKLDWFRAPFARDALVDELESLARQASGGATLANDALERPGAASLEVDAPAAQRGR